MTRRHSIKAKAGATWDATTELDGDSLQVGEMTPASSPDGPDYYTCCCGAEFNSEHRAVEHLKEVRDAE